MMTRKHFEAIAEILNAQNTENVDAWKTVNDIAESLSFYFQKENPQFNRAKFLSACGIED